jgi:hypothetical protein
MWKDLRDIQECDGSSVIWRVTGLKNVCVCQSNINMSIQRLLSTFVDVDTLHTSNNVKFKLCSQIHKQYADIVISFSIRLPGKTHIIPFWAIKNKQMYIYRLHNLYFSVMRDVVKYSCIPQIYTINWTVHSPWEIDSCSDGHKIPHHEKRIQIFIIVYNSKTLNPKLIHYNPLYISHRC